MIAIYYTKLLWIGKTSQVNIALTILIVSKQLYSNNRKMTHFACCSDSLFSDDSVPL